jgi:hypothetical protein
MRQHERARAQLAPVTQPHSEPLAPDVGIDHGGVPHLDGGEVRELLAPGAAQLDWREAAVAEQPSDRTLLDVRWAAGVEHEDSPARPTEDQRGAKTSRSAPDHDHVQLWHPRTRMPVTQTPPLAMSDGPERGVAERGHLAGHGRSIGPSVHDSSVRQANHLFCRTTD